jgi:lysophospholipase L1-like esterase
MIKKTAVVVLAVFFLIGGLNSSVWAKSKKKHPDTPVYYLALGTSLAAGVQADPSTGENVVSDVSYPSELAAIIGQDIDNLRLVNLGCPGETAESFIYGGICAYPHGSQLGQAVAFLHAHRKKTALITIDIGANDVLQCVNGTDIDSECLVSQLEQLSLDLSYILETLHEVAPRVPVVGMNYYNPLLAYYFQDPAFAEKTITFQIAINTTLESIYAIFGVGVADVAGAFMAYDFTTDANGNNIPDSVDLICLWTWMCQFQNIHPNDTGYAVIAQEFASVLPPLLVSIPPRKHFRWQNTK